MMIELHKLNSLMESKSIEELNILGGVEGLAKGLRSDIRDGIKDSDFDQRKKVYGENILERKPPPSIMALFLEAMQDTTVVILLIAAVVSIIIGSVVCAVNLGSVCPRTPLWNVGSTPLTDVSYELNV